jgi:DNA repair protein RadA/Sms
VRAVGQTETRLKEAAKLGFTRALMPRRRKDGAKTADIETRELARLADLVRLFQDAAGRVAR